MTVQLGMDAALSRSICWFSVVWFPVLTRTYKATRNDFDRGVSNWCFRYWRKDSRDIPVSRNPLAYKEVYY